MPLDRNKLIDYLVSAHHTHCCDCATYREAAHQDPLALLLHEYCIQFGEGTQAETDRLHGRDVEALCMEIAKKKGHTL